MFVETLTRSQAAAYLMMKTSSLHGLVLAGVIKAVMQDGNMTFDQAELENYIAEHPGSRVALQRQRREQEGSLKPVVNETVKAADPAESVNEALIVRQTPTPYFDVLPEEPVSGMYLVSALPTIWQQWVLCVLQGGYEQELFLTYSGVTDTWRVELGARRPHTGKNNDGR